MKPAFALTALLILAAVPVIAAPTTAAPTTAAPETRPPTDAELASFHAHYRQQFPNKPPAKPVFSIARANPKSAWTISASVDSPAQAGAGRLCRMTRTDFRYDVRAGGRWSAAGQPRAFAWVERPACEDTARAVEMLHPLPDTEVVGLLAQRLALLHAARILLAGNTSCASQRSYKYELARIDVGSAGASPEVMAGLVFKSDHGTFATVWARRSGATYNAWNVSCE